MRRLLPRLVALGVGVALVATSGCATRADTNPLRQQAPVVSGGRAPAADPAAVTDAAIADITAYWERTYPSVYGGEFQDLAGGLFPYGPDTELPPCGPEVTRYEDVADNAFYCARTDLIAWDAERLIPWINENFGAFTIGIVFAHEFAHAIQARAGVDGPRTVDLELQADCFAGAWTADVVAGNSPAFDVDESGLDASVAGLVAISDVPGTAENDPLAHGSGFDRIGSFLEGYEGGPGTCAAYDGTQRRTVEIPFYDRDDVATGGNMPLYDQGPEDSDRGLLTRAEIDLNSFYDELFGELGRTFEPVDALVVVDPDEDEVRCGGESLSGEELAFAALYCVDENQVVLDGPGLVEGLYNIGDFAVAAEIARLWAQAAQVQLGIGEGRRESLQADCLTGVWVLWTFPRDTDGDGRDEVTGPRSDLLRISAGDLDEGIMGFLAYGQDIVEEAGTVFERTAALRDGFIDGRGGCEQYAPLG